nr:MAG TPA: hypothetical protein [Crassvirales sp.]
MNNLKLEDMDEPYNWEEFPYEVDEPEFNED